MLVEKYPFPYYFYIITNKNRTVLYCGMTNNLEARLWEHERSEGDRRKFAGRYNCHFLVYYEGFDFVIDAIDREKEVKKWNRSKKERLICSLNPDWSFLNDGETFDHAARSYDSHSREE
jgi:putative endonuclease